MKNNGNESHDQHGTGSVHERAPTFSKEELAQQQIVFSALYDCVQHLLIESPYAELKSIAAINSDYVANTVAETDVDKAEQLVSFEKSGLVYAPGNLYRIIEYEGPDGPPYVRVEYLMPSVSKINDRKPRSEYIEVSKGYGLYTAKRVLRYANSIESTPLNSEESAELNTQLSSVKFVSNEEYESRRKELDSNKPEAVASKGLLKLLKRKKEKA